MARSVYDETNVPAADTYEDLKRSCYLQCWKHIQRCGGDFDEARSVTDLAFMEAYDRWDPERGAQFNTFLWHYVRGRLLNWSNRQRKLSTNTVSEHGETIADRTPTGLQHLFSEVGEDARAIIGLVVEAPGELAELSQQEPERWLKALWRTLRKAGWDMGRISVGMDEIREAVW